MNNANMSSVTMKRHRVLATEYIITKPYRVGGRVSICFLEDMAFKFRSKDKNAINTDTEVTGVVAAFCYAKNY